MVGTFAFSCVILLKIAEEKVLREQEDRDVETGSDVTLSGKSEVDKKSESGPVEFETPPDEVVITQQTHSQEGSTAEQDEVNRVASAQPAPKREAVTAPAAPAAPKKAKGRYRFPKVSLLDEVPSNSNGIDRKTLLENARKLEEALDNFDVAGKVVEVSPGPVVTRYEVCLLYTSPSPRDS